MGEPAKISEQEWEFISEDPSAEFTWESPPQWPTFTYTDRHGVTHTEKLDPEKLSLFDNPCDAYDFVKGASDARIPFTSEAKKILNDLGEDCQDWTIKKLVEELMAPQEEVEAMFGEPPVLPAPSTPAPGEEPEPLAQDGPPPSGGETAESLAAPPKTPPLLRAYLSPPPPGKRGARSLAEQYFSPKDPLPDYAVADVLVNEGVLTVDIATEVERVRHNEPEDREAHPEFSLPRRSDPAVSGDPVDLFTGQFLMEAVDVEIASRGFPLQLRRVYRSGPVYFGPWGFNWDHNYNVYLRELSRGRIAIWTGHLGEDVYVPQENGAFIAPLGRLFQLERNESIDPAAPGYVLTAVGGFRQIFARPEGWPYPDRIPLVSLEDRHGNVHALLYDAEGRLGRVQDDAGRFIRFEYGDCGLLERIADHTNRVWQYRHHPEVEHLIGVTAPATADFPQGASTCYEYDEFQPHPALRHNITRVLDTEYRTVVVNTYENDPSSEDFGRVVRQDAAANSVLFKATGLRYVPQNPDAINVPALRVEVATQGSLRVYTFNYRGDLCDQRFRLSRDGSYRLVAYGWEYDSDGNIVNEVRPDGGATVYTFDSENANPLARGNLLQIELVAPPGFITPSRIVFRARYDPVYQLPIEQVAENGARTRYMYDFDESVGPHVTGKLVRIESPEVSLPDGSPQQSIAAFETNSRGQVTATNSPEGIRSELRYAPDGTTAAGLVSEVEHDVGGIAAVTRWEHDSRGFISRVVDSQGASTDVRYDDLGRLSEVTLPEIGGIADSVRYEWSAHGRLMAVNRPRGSYQDGSVQGEFIRDEFRRNCLGHVVGISQGANTATPRNTAFCRTADGRSVEEIDPAGVKTLRTYDERGLLLSETRAPGTSVEMQTRATYDRTGRLVELAEPGQRVTRFAYDAWGRLQSVEQPNGAAIAYEWGPLDRVVSRTVTGTPGSNSPARVLERQTFEHDERGRLVKSTHLSFDNDVASAVALPTVYWYDRDDRLVKLDFVRDAVWTYQYDNLGRSVRLDDPIGNVVVTEYSKIGLPLSVRTEDVEGESTRIRTVTYEYDSRQRLIKQITPAGETEYTHDSRDLVIGQVDAHGVTTEYHYGLLGELLKTVNDVGGLNLVHEYEHDLLGRPLAYHDPTHEKLILERDLLGRLVKLRLADGSEYQSSYDEAGNLKTVSAASGSIVELSYDAAGRPIGISAIPGPGRLPVAPHAFVYDGLDRIVEATAGAASVIRTFDGLGRLRTESVDNRLFQRVYDDLAGIATITYPDGRQEEHQWDTIGRVRTVTLKQPGTSLLGAVSGAAGSVIYTIDYSGDSRVRAIAYGNGVMSEWHYDSAGRTIRVDHRGPGDALLESARYRHDRSSRRRVSQLLGQPAESVVNDFDAQHRLTRAARGFALSPLVDADDQAAQETDIAQAKSAASGGASHVEAFSLDGSDSRLSADVTDNTSTTTINYVTQSGHRVVAAGSEPIAYDDDGNRTGDGARSYAYDALGRCVEVTDTQLHTVVATFGYDALGRRSRAELGSSLFRRYYFGEAWLQEEDAAAVVTRQRTVDPTLMLPVAELVAQGVAHVHVDGHLNRLLVTDSSGLPAERYRYSAFGEPTILQGNGNAVIPASNLNLEPVFGGMAYCAEADLYLTPTRLFDPRHGLFTGRDPELYATSASPYVLTAHDPIDLVDASGAQPESALGGPVIEENAYVAGVGGGYPSALRRGEEGSEGAAPTPYSYEPPTSLTFAPRSFLTRGGGTLAGGGLALGLGLVLLASNPAGWFVLLSTTLLIAGGTTGVGVGAIQLGVSYSGLTSEEQDENINQAAGLMMSLADPVGLPFGVGGALITGDAEGLETGAFVGNVVHAGGSFVSGVAPMTYREVLYGLPKSSKMSSARPRTQKVYGLGDKAKRVRLNPLMPGGIERIDLSHWIPHRWIKGTFWEAFANRPWNLTPMWATEHALADWYVKDGQIFGRFRFLPEAARDVYGPLRLHGVEKNVALMPPWARRAGYGIGVGLNLPFRRPHDKP